MSTHAITCFLSREHDGRTMVEVGHTWRKFDGQPTTHANQLKLLIGESKFPTLWNLMGAVSRLTVNVRGKSYDWMFVPFNPERIDLGAEFKYYLSLADENGEPPRGGSCDYDFDVHIRVTRDGATIYSGLLRDYEPDDDAPELDGEEDWDEDSGLYPFLDVALGVQAQEERNAMMNRLLAYASHRGKVPRIFEDGREICGRDRVIAVLQSMSNQELRYMDDGMKRTFGPYYFVTSKSNRD